MKKVLYLHGLESTSAGKKAELLMESFMVHAPTLNYYDPNIYNILKQKVSSICPDIIVGSSMGGYMAQVLVTNHYASNHLILINPALKSPIKGIDFPSNPDFVSEFGVDSEPSVLNVNLILGKDDDIIDSNETSKLYHFIGVRSPWLNIEIDVLEDVGHRINTEQFKHVLKKRGYIK